MPPQARPAPHGFAVRPLHIGLAAALLAWAFLRLGSEMAEGDTLAFDLQIVQAARALRLGHPGLVELLRDLSGLGSTLVLSLWTAATVGYLLLVSARALAALVATAVLTGSLGLSLLKALFGRMRPGPDWAELVAPGLSFPSGHAAMSAIVFLTLGALLASTHVRHLERIYLLAVATLMTLLVGLSRIALGVHWATDVLAGWAFGAAWALAWWLLARALEPAP
jgi:undecaprenyl-diphosphatase